MKIPFLFGHKNSIKLYLGVYFHELGGTVMLIHMKDNAVHLVDKEDFTFSNSWDTLTEDLDNAFSMLEKRNQGSVGDTIFFVNSNLIDPETKQINKVYLHKIKSAVKNLDLKALGFIEAYEGVVRILSEREAIQPSATIVEVDATDMTVLVVKSGKLAHWQTIARTDNPLEDLGTVFYQVKGDGVLPSRVIVYSTEDITQLVSHLASHSWHETVFIQLPKVEIIKTSDLLSSLVQVFGTQLLSPDAESSQSSKEPDLPKAPVSVMPVAPTPSTFDEPVEAQEEDLDEPDKEAVGAVEEQHSPQQDQELSDQGYEDRPVKRVVSPADDAVELMGFKLNGDITEDEEMVRESVDEPRSKKSFVPHISFPSLSLKGGWLPKILIVLGVLGLFAVGVFANEYYLHSAQVTVYFPSEKVGDTITYTGTPQADSGEVRIATGSSDVNVNTPATGKKDIGDKAKGTVTVHNFDDKEKTFAKGTTIAAGNIKFVLNGDVKVASASIATDGSAKLPGKANIDVTAADIGDDFNLAKGQQFKIEDLPTSTYFARNDEALSGGTKKTLTVVSKKDIDTLKAKALTEAAKKDEKTGSSSADLALLDEQEIDTAKYSAQVGDEAKTVTLRAKVAKTSYVVNDEAMKEYLSQELKDKVEAGKVLQPDKIVYSIQKATKKGNNVTLILTANAVSVKAVDANKVKHALPGVKRSDLDKTIKNQYGAERYDVQMRQPIPFLNSFMPPFEKNITVKISYL